MTKTRYSINIIPVLILLGVGGCVAKGIMEVRHEHRMEEIKAMDYQMALGAIKEYK